MSACVCGSKEKFRASAGGPAMSEESGVEWREDWEGEGFIGSGLALFGDFRISFLIM